MSVDQSVRVERLLATQQVKLEGLFKGRKFEIVQKVTPDFLAGKGKDKLTTPLGNKGRRGYLVRKVSGPDIVTNPYVDGTINRDSQGRQWFFVGEAVLQKMSDMFDAVELPATKTEDTDSE